MCQPVAALQLARSASSKLNDLSRSSSSARSARASSTGRSGVRRHLRHLPGVDAQPAGPAATRQVRYAFEDRGPHVELDLLREPEPVVHQLGEPVAAARPRLDLELDELSIGGAELDLAGLEMAGERDQPE